MKQNRKSANISRKKSIRIPFTSEEHKYITKLSDKAHLKRATKVTANLIDELELFISKNQFGLSLNFEYIRNKVANPLYVQITVKINVYEKLRNISDSTNISIPYICRYLILPKILKEIEEEIN